MRFVSLEMMTWFFALVAVTWCLPKSWQLNWISLATMAFLALYAPLSLTALILVTGICYLLGRRQVVYALVICIAMLLIYRWYSSGNPMQSVSLRANELTAPQVFVLMGFSYYILRAIHYLLEQLKGRLPNHGFLDLINYLFFLPTFFVGPINRFPEFFRDIHRRRWDANLFSLGATRITYGLFKIVFIAYYLVNRKMGFWIDDVDPANTMLLQYLDCWQYGLNLYFQFSGYCDVAIGVSAMLGFRIMENFNYPFLSPNISEFWRRWHMSLTGWSREYVYPSVAAATRSPYFAIFVSMLFIGLWHEFSPKYFLWGLYHGLGIITHRVYQRLLSGFQSFTNPLARWTMWSINVTVTMHFVIFGFILNKEQSLTDSWFALNQLLGL